jgi:WXG100 family type VII secretion target
MMTTPGEYSYDFTTAENIEAQMERVTSQITGDLQDLDAVLATQLAGWEDAAKEQYRDAQRNWDAAAIALPGQLQAARSVLNTIGQTYGDTIRAGVQTWDGSFGVR